MGGWGGFGAMKWPAQIEKQQKRGGGGVTTIPPPSLGLTKLICGPNRGTPTVNDA